MAQSTVHKKHQTEFQFILSHRRIPTNDFWLKIGRKENDIYAFCNNSSDTLIHLFWSCHVSSSFKKSVTDWLQNALPLIGKYNLLNISALRLRPEPHSTEYSRQLNYCTLLARFHIWKGKMDEISPNFASFLSLVNSRFIILENYIYLLYLKNGTFLQIALNTALDIDCFLSPDGQIPRNWKNCKSCI